MTITFHLRDESTVEITAPTREEACYAMADRLGIRCWSWTDILPHLATRTNEQRAAKQGLIFGHDGKAGGFQVI